MGVFLLRVWWEQRSYRTAMVLGGVTSVVGVAQFAFLGLFLNSGGTFAEADIYGGDVAAFMISGTIFTGFVSVALSGFSGTLQREQVSGTLEAINGTRAGIFRVMIMSSIAAFGGTVMGSLLMLTVFAAVLDFTLQIDYASVVVVLVFILIVLGGFGMAGAGVVLVTKKGEPVTWLIITLTTLLSGVLYPVSILPAWLQALSHALPTTVALDLLRRALLASADIGQILANAVPLLAWGSISVPLGFVLLRAGLLQSRRRGTLGQY